MSEKEKKRLKLWNDIAIIFGILLIWAAERRGQDELANMLGFFLIGFMSRIALGHFIALFCGEDEKDEENNKKEEE